MSLLKTVNRHVLRVGEMVGLSRLVLESGWRRRRLLILCYHGFSTEDEHLWKPSLYMRQEVLRRHLQLLRGPRCEVLPLGQALSRLAAGNLPPRSVAITVDDGFYDFYKMAWPVFQSFGYPVTVYLSTYYSEFNRPVFDPAVSYMLWKAGERTLDWPRVLESPVRLDPATRKRIEREVADYTRQQDLSGRQKDELLAELASRVGLDYDDFCARRMFTLMAPAEVREAASAGVDMQLHTHRHRVYTEKDKFLGELEENRTRIEAATGSPARHFCYPSGFWLPAFVPWLREWGAASATVCTAGLAVRDGEPMLLPRLVDSENISETELIGWISGLAAMLPHRRRVMDSRALH